MKAINLLLPLTVFLLPQQLLAQGDCSNQTAQSIRNLNGPAYRNPNPALNRFLRTTAATGSRIVGETDLNNDGASFVYSDSIILSYSGTRGGDLNSLGTGLKFDDAYVYYYNTTTSVWEINTHEFQTFDGSNEMLTTVAQGWHASTSAWVNSGENLYTWSGGNLQSYIYQTWDTVGSAWVNSDKYLFTYDGSGNRLTETDQVWSAFHGAWINNYQYTYTYNTNNKVTSEIDQNWDSTSSSWQNQSKYTYTYDATNTYMLSDVNQNWNSGTSTWDNNTQDIFTYDGMNNRLTDLHQNWGAAVWVNADLATYSSFVAQLPQTEIDQAWNTTTLGFDNNAKYTYTYNSFNQMTTSESESWNIGGFWQPTSSDRESRFYYQDYTTGVKQLAANDNSVVLYPVPAGDVLHADIKWSEPQPFSVTVYSMQGSVLKQWDVPACADYTMNMPLDLPSGDYFIRFNGASGNMVKQFAVVR